MIWFHLGVHTDVPNESSVLLTCHDVVQALAVSGLRPLICVQDGAFPTSWRAKNAVGDCRFML